MADEIAQGSQKGGDEGSRATAPVSDTGFDRSALEAKVSKGLAALRDDAEPEVDQPIEEDASSEETEAEAEVTPDSSSDEPAKEVEPSDEGDEQSDEPEEEQDQQPKPKAAKVPTIPAALRRSLKAYDWTDEEIDEAAAGNPAGFLLTAQKIHMNRNKELAQWADMGRQTRVSADQTSTNQKETSQHRDPKTGAFKALDVDAMVEKYGNEDLVREIASPVNDIIQQINTLLPDLMTGISHIQQTRQQTLAKEIDGFFGGKDLANYTEVYGTDSNKLSTDNLQARNKVLEMADALVAGARQQGRTLKVNEALMLAHDSVSGDFKTKSIRKELTASVKKRNSGITMRPSQAGSKDNRGAPKSSSELEARTKARLAKVFGNA